MHSPVLRKRVSSTATPTNRPGHQARARSRMGANNCCGSHSARECRKYSALQLRCSPPLVQITRDRVRRPRQTSEPRAWRTARRAVRACANTFFQSVTISSQVSSSMRLLCFPCNDETLPVQKKSLLLGPQKRVVGFANRFQPRLQLLVVLQPPLHLGLHLWTDAVLLGKPAGIADGQHPDAMAAPALALRAPPLVANGALKQGT